MSHEAQRTSESAELTPFNMDFETEKVLTCGVLDRAPLPVVTLWGPRHIVAYVNAGFCRLMDRSSEQLVGRALSELLPLDDKCIDLVDRVFRTGQAETNKLLSDSSSASFFAAYTAWPLSNRDGPVGVMLHVTEKTAFNEQMVAMNEAIALGFIRQHELTAAAETLNEKLQQEITARAKAENEIAAERDKAIAAVKARDDFLAALSHELRTPLNPVLLLAEEVAENAANPVEVREVCAKIVTAVKLEARLIDDLLDLARIAHGKLTLDLKPVDVHAALRDACEMTQADFTHKQITLRLAFAETKPWVLGDAVRLEQVFWNVLRNAAKFTPPEGIVTVETAILEGKTVRITVTDTGIGMTREEIEAAFGMFTQGDHALHGARHRFGGLGLGLAISRVLTEAHSGKLTAESAGRDRGSSFHIDLSIHRTHEAEKSPPPSALAADMHANDRVRRILLVEDHEPSRAALAQLLTRRHYDVVAVPTIADARRAAQSSPFDVLISDLGLPDGNGHDLMTELSESYHLPGIAITGYGKEDDVAQSLRVGFVSHLTKPVSMSALQHALDLVVAEKGKPHDWF